MVEMNIELSDQATDSSKTTATIPTITFITGNLNKLREVKEILAGTVDVESKTLDLIEIQGTIEEIIKDKVRRAASEVWLSFPAEFL
jgi:hypothetical protein